MTTGGLLAVAVSWDAVIRSGVVVIGLLVVWWVIVRAGNRVTTRMIDQATAADATRGPERGQRINTLWTVARTVLVVVLVLAGAFTLLSVWNISVAPLLAISSVAGVAIGFGAQNFIKDVIAGFLIVAEDQFAIGDVVRISGVAGVVEAVRLRTTVLRDLDGNVHHVPNGSIEVASNLTQDYSQVVLDIGVAYKENVDQVITVIEDEINTFVADPQWSSMVIDDPQILGVDQLGEWSVTIRAVLKVLADSRWTVKRELQRRIKNRLDAEGIEIPFPYITVVQAEDRPAE
jgi:small-conductance mechanosensitive channel